MLNQDELLGRKEAAQYLRICERTLDRIPHIPRVKIGQRRIMFRRADLADYIADRTETRTAA
ncbi:MULTISPECIES: helix-turn-helix transcriptional regulator [Acidiphilium]|uniref:Helix-turn-helix domain-containing protein n=1 Tax=Acidiphilium rubrum TaxID=526 RepID=A0A8G2CJ77_ACIRU|nr:MULTISPECIES: helix-turn-helix domain-containing protein [Acidiphilium]SIQ46301.1 Helix-turn-helix domain-containing protein [Acidiphilium rubrum]